MRADRSLDIRRFYANIDLSTDQRGVAQLG